MFSKKQNLLYQPSQRELFSNPNFFQHCLELNTLKGYIFDIYFLYIISACSLVISVFTANLTLKGIFLLAKKPLLCGNLFLSVLRSRETNIFKAYRCFKEQQAYHEVNIQKQKSPGYFCRSPGPNIRVVYDTI